MEIGMDAFSHPAHGDKGTQRGLERMLGSGLGSLNSGSCSVTNQLGDLRQIIDLVRAS